MMDKYAGKSKWYVFPMMTIDPKYSKTKKYFNQKSSCTALVNKRLKVIQHDLNIPFRLTTHIARHTFAHLADISGADSREIQGMLEHSSLEQTERYIKVLRQTDRLNTAADKVFDKFMPELSGDSLTN
jgi:site-specific recombinase XerD